MKMEKSQQTTQTEIQRIMRLTISNYMPVMWTAWKKWTNHSRILYDPPPRVMEIKAKINKWDLIYLKAFAQRRKL